MDLSRDSFKPMRMEAHNQVYNNIKYTYYINILISNGWKLVDSLYKAFGKKLLTRRKSNFTRVADAPMYLFIMSLDLTKNIGMSVAVAKALTSSVLPVPGGP